MPSGRFRTDPTRCRSGKHLLSELGEMLDGRCRGCFREWHARYYAIHSKRMNAARRLRWKKTYVPHPVVPQDRCRRGHIYAEVGRQSDGHCSECRRIRDLARWHRRTTRGHFTASMYDRAFAEQKGLCAVCQKPETRTIRGRLMRLVADHDHNTMEFRGLMCHRCNVALGMLRDDPIAIKHLLEYRLRYCVT